MWPCVLCLFVLSACACLSEVTVTSSSYPPMVKLRGIPIQTNVLSRGRTFFLRRRERTRTVFPHGPHTVQSTGLHFKAVQAVVTVSHPRNRHSVISRYLIHLYENLRNARTNIMKGSRSAESTPAASPPPASAPAPHLLHRCLPRSPPRARLAHEPPAAASPLVRPQFHAPRHRAYS